MNNQLITFKTAKLAKEVGFKEGVHGYFVHYITEQIDSEHGKSGSFGWERDELTFDDSYMVNGDKNLGDFSCEDYQCYSRPTQSLLQKFLREIHGYHIVIIPTITSNWTFKIVKVISEADNDYISGIKSVSDMPPYKEVSGYDFSTYEDALEEGLYEALQFLE